MKHISRSKHRGRKSRGDMGEGYFARTFDRRFGDAEDAEDDGEEILPQLMNNGLPASMTPQAGDHANFGQTGTENGLRSIVNRKGQTSLYDTDANGDPRLRGIRGSAVRGRAFGGSGGSSGSPTLPGMSNSGFGAKSFGDGQSHGGVGGGGYLGGLGNGASFGDNTVTNTLSKSMIEGGNRNIQASGGVPTLLANGNGGTGNIARSSSGSNTVFRPDQSDDIPTGAKYARGGQVQGLRELRRGGQEEIPAQKMVRPPGYKWGTQPQPAQQQPAQQQAPVRDGYKWDDQKDMRGLRQNFNRGGVVHPGVPKAGKIKIPEGAHNVAPDIGSYAEPTGPIGDVAMDTGEDTQEVMVREGEYLLNPETVAFLGEGSYENGVRNLNQIVEQATGEQPGPEMVDQEMYAAKGGQIPGFQLGGFVDDYGNLADPRTMSPAERAFLNTPDGRLAMQGNTRAAQAEATAARSRLQSAPEVEVRQRRAEPKVTREQQAWRAEQARQNSVPEVAQQQAPRGAAAEQWAKSNPDVNMEGLRNVGRQVIQKGKYALKPVEWAVKGANKAMPYVAPAFEGAAIADVATDPRMNGYDIAEQGFESAGKLAAMGIGAKVGATGGAGIGTAFFPGPGTVVGTALGGLIGGAGGYIASDYVLDKARGALPGHNGEGSSPSDRSYGAVRQAFGMDDPMNPGGVVQQNGQQQVAPPPAPYGRAFDEGNVDLGAAQERGLRSASEAVGPGGMNIVQNTGGPNGEVIIREDLPNPNGVGNGMQETIPTFSNLRRGGFRGDARTLQAEADARAAQDVGIRQMQAQAVQQMRDNAPIYDQAGVANRRSEELAMQQTAMEAAGRAGNGTKATVFRKSLEDRYQVLGEDGTPQGADLGKVDIVEKVISQLNPGIIERWGVPFQELPEHMRQAVFTQDIDPILNDTTIARQAQKNQDYPTSNIPRTGKNSLRVRPGSDISFWGDAMFGNATLNEYRKGMWNDNHVMDRMVEDPLGDRNAANNRIPLQRLLKGAEDEQEALDGYRYDG